MEERVQKLLSACGAASRRQAERYIEEGRVTVNGKTARLGEKADPERDVILLDGRQLARPEGHTYLLLHKPKGYVTTLSDEFGRKTVAQLTAGSGKRLWPVGRLDYASEGLLIMTDDGDLTHRLLHPSHVVEKEYLVDVVGDMEKALPVLEGPLWLDGVKLAPAGITLVEREGKERARLSVVIHEGKNRQVRRMCAAAGLEVRRLIRVREGELTLGDLPAGCWRALTRREVEALRGSGRGE